MKSDLRKLLIAQLPADFADWLDFVAIGALLAFVWQEEPFVFAVLAVAIGLPYLLVGPVAGVLVDKAPIRRVLVLSNLGRGVVTATLFFAPNWGVLMLLVALRSTVDTFFTPAKQAAIQALTTPDERTRANGFSHAINQTSKVAAPALGGGLLIWLAPHMIFLLNAGVSILAALLALRINQIARPPASEAAQSSMIGNIKTGFADIRRAPVLRAALWMMAAGYFAMFFYDTLIAPLTRDLGFTQTQLGFALAAIGAGGVLGSLYLALRKDAGRPFLWIASGLTASACIIGYFGLAEILSFPLRITAYIGLCAVVGAASALSVVPFRTLIQNHSAAERIARITALSEAANTLALLTAPFIGAAIATLTSLGMSFVAGGCMMLAVAFSAWRMRNAG